MQTKLLVERQKKGVTKLQMAEYLGISYNAYRSKEKGTSCFTSDEMFKIAEYFECLVDDIFLPRG